LRVEQTIHYIERPAARQHTAGRRGWEQLLARMYVPWKMKRRNWHIWNDVMLCSE
jgi:hypothetical protein